MPPKKIKVGAEHGYLGDVKTKSKPKPYIESEWVASYRKDRDICYYIQHGGEKEWSEDEVELVRGKYFTTLF